MNMVFNSWVMDQFIGYGGRVEVDHRHPYFVEPKITEDFKLWCIYHWWRIYLRVEFLSRS